MLHVPEHNLPRDTEQIKKRVTPTESLQQIRLQNPVESSFLAGWFYCRKIPFHAGQKLRKLQAHPMTAETEMEVLDVDLKRSCSMQDENSLGRSREILL